MKIVLTGFDPFGGESVNPAWEAVKLVKAPAGAELIRLEVPTVFGRSIRTVMESVRLHRPDAVVCVGQAAGRSEITPERVAINIADASIPDNEGNQPCDEPIVPGGETACFSTLPVKAMVEAIRAAGLPSSLSNTAGTFVCNQLMYGLLYHISREFPGMRGGFIHVPCIPEQAARAEKPVPSLPLPEIVRGLEAALSVLAELR